MYYKQIMSKWALKFVALLKLDLPYNGEKCETKINAFESRCLVNKAFPPARPKNAIHFKIMLI